jgi:predicted nucleic acid-binding protein
MTMRESALAGVTRLGLDTAPIIYFVEAHPRYDALVTRVFQRIASGVITGITSVISLTEVLAQPIRRGQAQLAQRYDNLLLNSANLVVMPIDVDVARRAAGLRAQYSLRTPDALQIAVALAAGCQAFLTNDKNLKRVAELQVLILDELS